MATRFLVIRKGSHEHQIRIGRDVCGCMRRQQVRQAGDWNIWGMSFWFSVCVALHNPLKMRMGYGRKVGSNTGKQVADIPVTGESLMLRAN